MVRPEKASTYEDLDLKLGIKSSLPNVKSTLALIILLWEATDQPAALEYAEKNGNDELVLASSLKNQIIKFVKKELDSHNISEDIFLNTLNDNQLFKSQIESLIVAFELIWKLAKVSFVDSSKPFSAERTGGIRYEKRLNFSCNMDIIHSIINVSDSDSNSAYINVILKWIGLNIQANEDDEKNLLNVLNVLAEGALFKLTDGNRDVIFNQNSIYKSLTDSNNSVDIDGDSEAKGSLRILKSSLSDDLNPYLKYKSGKVSAKDGKKEVLTSYQKRVDTLLRLSATKVVEPDEQPKLEDDKPNNDSPIKFNSDYQSDLPRNKIYFGAPGTGKSYTLNGEKTLLLGEDNEADYERVTFHPDYSYANFVGTYKPTMVEQKSHQKLDESTRQVLEILNDQNKLPKEKYDLIDDLFKSNGIDDTSRIPILLGITGIKGKDLKDITNYAEQNGNHGYALSKYVQLSEENSNEKSSEISYEYVPGPFMRMYVKALKNAQKENSRPFLLIIEEINRANVAAVFGDIFQLLDRDDNHISEYPIQASEDNKKYLAKEFKRDPKDFDQIRIPNNLFIWATMNSADQGVFPMDTAFKRRWDFTYLGINDNAKEIANKSVTLNNGEKVYWNGLRIAINDYLAKNGINEDKQLGPFFLKNNDISDNKKFCDVFKHKIIMYLFEDAAKQKRASLFSGFEKENLRYSIICEEFDRRGIEIFNKEIQDKCRKYDPAEYTSTNEEES